MTNFQDFEIICRKSIAILSYICYNMLLDLYNAVSAQSTVDIDREMLRAEELLDI